ncbi:MAG: lysoplasmalogenase [Bacteroidetes bacterium]|nr:lysoplasmalogenase [Bacteroidota bacterium]
MNITAALYLLTGLVDVYAEYAHLRSVTLISRPLLMPLLLACYLSATGLRLTARDRLMAGAIAFSWIGDVVLMSARGRELWFLGGLVAFLIAHLFYIVAFMQVADREAQPVLRRHIWLALPLAAYLAGLLSVLIPAVEVHMRAPIAIYSLVIGTMVLFSINRFKRVNNRSFALVFGGAVLFMLSDSLIAINKFLCHGDMWLSGVWIMILYILGQYCITQGMIRNDKPILT